MHPVVKTVMILYKEIQTILNDNGIANITGGQTPHMLIDMNNRYHFQGTLYVLDADADGLYKLLSKVIPENRELEIIHETGKEDRLNYVNKETTFLEFTNIAKYKHPGVHVNIIPVKKGPDKDTVRIYNINERLVEIPKSFLTDVKTYKYRGYDLQMPADLKGYYDVLYINSSGKFYVPLFSIEKYLYSATVPYGDFLDKLGDRQQREAEIKYLEKDIAERTEIINKRNAEVDVVLYKVRDLYEINLAKFNLH